MKVKRLTALLLSFGLVFSFFACEKSSDGSSENGGGNNGGSYTQTESGGTENGDGNAEAGGSEGNENVGGNGGNGGSGNGGEATHTHSWGFWSTTLATCVAAGKKVRTCSECGDTEEQILEKRPHTYSTTECTACHTPLVASNGLTFKLRNGNSEYSALLLYCTAEEIVIPATYEGLPVTYVNGSLYDETTNSSGTNTTTKHIYIPEGVTGFNFPGGFMAVESISLPSTIEKIPDQGLFFLGMDTLTTIYYGGTAKEWVNLEKGTMWNHGTTDTVIASDGIERNLNGSMKGGLPSLFGRYDNNK